MLYDNSVMNLNDDCEKNSEKGFALACELSERDFTHSEMIKMLETGNLQEKQYAAMSLDTLESAEEGKILIGSLTGCDGKIREAVALKINQLLANKPETIEYLSPHPEIFADASIDINANICRLVIDSAAFLRKDTYFKEGYLKKILGFIQETFAEIDKFIFRDKKYVINKQLFKLYWCLEGLKLFVDDIKTDELFQILERASKEKEYTIREKTAQILGLTNNSAFAPLVEKLKQDENYYVRAALNGLTS